MSDLPIANFIDKKCGTLSSYVQTIPPIAQQVPWRETYENCTEEVVECSKYTKCTKFISKKWFIDKSIKISWQDINDTFIQKKFQENLEDM